MGPSVRVAAPPVQVAAHGLLDAMLKPTDIAAERRWELGYDFTPQVPADLTYLLGPLAGTTAFTDLPDPIDADPISVYVPIKARISGDIEAELEARIRLSLGQAIGIAVERHVWSNPKALAIPQLVEAYTPLSTTAVGAVRALGALLDEAGVIGRRFIHTSPSVANLWMAAGSIKEVSSGGSRTLQTLVGGHTVVAGLGYDATAGPAATPAESHWAVMTGLVVGELGAVTYQSTVSAMTRLPAGSVDAPVGNVMEGMAYQTARVFFDEATRVAIPVALG